MKEINVLSLFDGISCGQLALSDLGIKINKFYASEIEEEPIKITQKHFPNTIQLGDVTKLDTSNLPKIDLLIGGSPCQSFSSFGNGKGFECKSGLVWDYIRILKEVKPRYFLLENVKMKKEWRDIISKELGVEPIEINSKDFSAQSRTRLYWTNIKVDKWKPKNILFKDILEDLSFREIPKCFQTKWGDKKRIDKGLNWVNNDKGNCVTTKNCHTNQYLLNKNKTLCRLLTPNEYESLQTLPKDYTKGISNQARFKAIGNGWTLEVIKHLLKNISNN